MLRVALRRTLWAIPTLFGISLVVFFVTTLIPDPVAAALPPQLDAAASDRSAETILTERRRAHFLDLPRFVNSHPEDVRSRTEADVRRLVDGGRAFAERPRTRRASSAASAALRSRTCSPGSRSSSRACAGG